MRWFGWGIVLLALAGFQKPLQHEQAKTVEAGATWAVAIDPPVREQKITVSIASPGVPVDVFVIREGDPNRAKDAGSKALAGGKPIDGALAASMKTEAATLEATIAAQQGFSVVVNNPSRLKNAEVTLKVTSK